MPNLKLVPRDAGDEQSRAAHLADVSLFSEVKPIPGALSAFAAIMSERHVVSLPGRQGHDVQFRRDNGGAIASKPPGCGRPVRFQRDRMITAGRQLDHACQVGGS